MTNQLIPVFNGTVRNETHLLCNARNLHEFLGIGKRFATWITERISEYEFVENQDYIIISQNREIIKRGRPVKEYHLTLDTAKELAMVERNEKGRQVRRYFIECEKKLHQSGINADVFLFIRNGQVAFLQQAQKNEFFASVDAFIDAARKKGWLVIHPDDLIKKLSS